MKQVFGHTETTGNGYYPAFISVQGVEGGIEVTVRPPAVVTRHVPAEGEPEGSPTITSGETFSFKFSYAQAQELSARLSHYLVTK